MPFIEDNGAEIYYETFGEAVSGKTPVVLIHGSTGTGQSNWKLVAPLLGREYHVIVPDCRGHGKSSNPRNSYSFKEMAADTAALIRGLGYQRAHIIGHSNGGNVALVTLLEHPEVVQTAVPQAANAWVSPDLVEKEPAIFDPDRVAREDPEWMKEMIALHAGTHGSDYWRDLLTMTVEELIREPNYTTEDLAKVSRPTLVIQGEKDRVNAPYKHAQFIARHIPEAELWIPERIGHNVHDEILFPWLEKITSFLARRGDDENDAVYRLGRQRYPDERETVFQVRVEGLAWNDQERGVRLTGTVLTGEQRQAVVDLFTGRAVEDEVQVLLDENTPLALVRRDVTDMRREPRRLSERVSQARLGEALRILEDGEEWAKVRLECDGYMGWVQTASLYRCDSDQVDSYQNSCTHLVSADSAPAFGDPQARRGINLVETGRLSFGAEVAFIQKSGGMAEVCLPDGSRWWVPEGALIPIQDRPEPDAQIERTLLLIRRFVGIPYLWGGRTPFGFDCSGLAQAFWKFMGVQLPRDADQQFRAGAVVEGQFKPGDLLFFGEDPLHELLPGEPGESPRSITHVAISLGGNLLIHSAGSAGGVAYNSLDPDSPLYRSWLKENFAGARRFG